MTEERAKQILMEHSYNTFDAIPAILAACAEERAKCATNPVAWMLRKKSSGFVRGISAAKPDEETLQIARMEGDEWVPLRIDESYDNCAQAIEGMK